MAGRGSPGQDVNGNTAPAVGPIEHQMLGSSRLQAWLAGRELAGQKVSVPKAPAVGPTRKTRILDSCRPGGFLASWLAGLLGQGVK